MSTSSLAPFHLAIPVDDLAAARAFYGEVLGCTEGRSTDEWVDFNLFGHQLVCHVVPGHKPLVAANHVDGAEVPVPHFGVVLAWSEWETLAARLQQLDLQFALEPGVRFAGQPSEQATMFFRDPAGNALEFKAMRHPAHLFRPD